MYILRTKIQEWLQNKCLKENLRQHLVETLNLGNVIVLN
jgi:hypothetical protein